MIKILDLKHFFSKNLNYFDCLQCHIFISYKKKKSMVLGVKSYKDE